jgi:hypothetical protein
MYTIKITKIVEEDLLEIIQYFSEKLKSPIAVKKLIDLIEQKMIILEDSTFSDYSYQICHQFLCKPAT